MRLLLDTCAFLWIAWDDPHLSPQARALFQDPSNELFLSSVSAWEISVKHALGKLPLPEAPERMIPRLREVYGIHPLALEEAAIFGVVRLPDLHRDPFDRMLVCQAIAHGMVILTDDPMIRRYPVRCVW